MALEIQLVALGHRERGEPDKIWVEAKGNSRYCLSTLLENFWLAAKPENADGPAIAVRFV